MPPRRDRTAGKKSDEDSADEAEARTNVVMTEDQLSSLVSEIAKTQAETSRLLIENIMATYRGPVHSSDPSTSASPSPCTVQVLPGGSFAKCTARFDGQAAAGTSDEADVLEAFLDAVQTYKECANVSDEHALRGLPMLLTGEAAIWYRGVKDSTKSWDDALKRLRGMYGVSRPAYKIFREVFSQVHSTERADKFVSRVRALLAKLPYELDEVMKTDIIYGLLDRRIRKRVPRETVDTVDRLLEKARLVEESLAEVSTLSSSDPNSKPKPASNPTVTNPSVTTGKSPTTGKSDSNAAGATGSNMAGKSSDERTARRARPRCGFCRFFGHTSENCRNKSESVAKSDGRTTEKPDKAEAAEIRCYGCGEKGVIRSRCSNCRSAPTDKVEFHTLQIDDIVDTRPVVMIEVATHKGTAAFDTGASHSIASFGLHRLLVQEGVVFTETHRTVGLADGTQRVRPALTCRTVVNLRGRDIPTSFIVFPDADTRTLLGRDFIIQANIVLDLPRGIWNFVDKPEETYAFTKAYDLQSPSAAELMKVDTSQIALRDDEGSRSIVDERAQLNALLMKKADRFVTEGAPTDYAEHHIKVSEKQEPIVSPPYRLSENKKMILEQDLKKLLDADIIEESNCDLCFVEVDVPSRNPRDVRLNQLKDPMLPKVIHGMERSHEPFRGRVWSDQGFAMSDGILHRRYDPEADDEETTCLMVPYQVREISSPTTYAEPIGRYHASQLTPCLGKVQPPFKEKKRRGRPRKTTV